MKFASRPRPLPPSCSAATGFRFPVDAAPVYPRVLDDRVPAAWHHVEQYANNRIEADHSRLKHRLRHVPGLRTDRNAAVIITGLAFIQNLHRGHYQLGVDRSHASRVAAAFTELAQAT